MITISVAGLAVGLDTEQPNILANCEPFRTEADPALWISVTEEEVRAEMHAQLFRREEAEFVALHRKLTYRLVEHDRFLLHGAVIQMDGKAYIFTARSGVGKSTHIGLWMRCFGDRVRVVNGDKPYLWRKDGLWLACGSPWCGKEGWTGTECVPVAGLCFLERAPENWIRPATTDEILDRIFLQVPMPPEPEQIRKTVRLMDDFLSAAPCWRMGCTPTEDAARMSAETMCRE